MASNGDAERLGTHGTPDGGVRGVRDGTLTGPAVVPAPVTDEDAEARAKELQARLVVLRLREGTANFENREAIRREIRRLEEELAELGVDPDDPGDPDTRD